MSDNITEARIRKYSSGIQHLSQQMHERLPSRCRVETDVKAKMTLWNQLGDIDLLDKTARHMPTPTQDAPHERRALFTMVRHGGILVDEADLETILDDPTAHYGQMLSMAAGRKKDKVIIDAFDAAARVGEEGATEQLFDSNNVIADNNTGLVLVKILESKEKLDAAEVNELIPRHACISARQERDLLAETTSGMANSDYSSVHALIKGEITQWLNFDWTRSERLNNDSGGDRKCLFWAMDGILFGIASDVRVRVGEREDLSYDGQVYIRLNIGATRMEEKKCITVACVE